MPVDKNTSNDGYNSWRLMQKTISNVSSRSYSYPRRNTAIPVKDEKRENIALDGVMQSKPQFTSIGVGRKVAAASTGPSQDY